MLDQTASLLAAANLLSLALAAIGGGVLGPRAGLVVALVLAALNAALAALTGGWNERLVSTAVAGLLGLPMAAIVGRLRERARGAQQQAAEAVYARETLEVQVAELVRSEQGLRARTDQQAVLATVSQRALTATDLVALFEDVARRVAEVFDADAATVWTSGADNQLECRAVHTSRFQHAGVIAETVRKHAQYTLLVNQPVVVDDLQTDPRLRSDTTGGGLLGCGAAVPIVARGAPYAVLAVHSHAARSFARHELMFLEGVASLLTAAIERHDVEEGLQRQALHDPLTGLANRSLFQDRLAQALYAAKRDKKPLALMLMDLDRFKEINDTLGHQAGDQLLLEVAARLARSKRASDTVARLGGDEFALILPGVADLSTAARLASELLATIERPTSLQDQSVDIGASIGLAAYPEHGDDAEELLRRADVAMYAAKRGGLGVAVYASELDQHSRGRLALSSALRLAIEAGELVLHYQPQVDLKSGEIAGLEALVRWNHPELGLLGPDSFVGLAEEMGIIAAVDRWALNCALQQAHEWQADGLDLPISVNLSMRNVLDEKLTRVVGDLLEKWDIPPSQLELEITESSIMADPSKVQSVLAQCRALGVRIAIDDFGTGYSSLAYLKRLPVDSLKIDKSFVSDVVADKSNLAIVRSTIELGHNLGLHVVAEGVEDERTGRLLSQLRCDVAQGHHFSVPLAGEDVLPWLAKSRWRRTAQKYAA